MERAEQTWSSEASSREHILFLPGVARDAPTAERAFAEAGLSLEVLGALEAVADGSLRDAATLICTEERLDEAGFERLFGRLRDQPSWSNLPVVIITSGGKASKSSRRLMEVTNVTMIERPVHLMTLTSVATAAVQSRQRQHELRRAIVNRDHFLAMLGHELRNPLAALSMGLARMEADHGEAGPPAESVEMLRRQATQMERIVDDLQEVSRIGRGKISFDIQRIDLVDIVDRVVETYRPIIADNALELQRSRQGVEHAWIDGDAARLEQAVGNLISNAVRYTPEGGVIEVETARDGDRYCVAVRDTGMGIAADKIEHIFGLFDQAHGEFHRREGGLGLGLSLVEGIVEGHNGEVFAQSPGPDQGSVFVIRLPARRAPDRAERKTGPSELADASLAQPGRAAALLFVEDVDDLRVPFAHQLRKLGYDVDEARRGLDAVERVGSGHYDAILLDIGLPDIDGYQVAHRVRQVEFSGLIVALTGYGAAREREEARQAGIDTVLTKPVDIAELKRVLESGQKARPDRPA